VEFARGLFDEEFAWQEADTGRQDVIGPSRKSLVRSDARHTLDPSAYGRLRRAFRVGAEADELAAEAGGVLAPSAGQSAQSYLADVLGADERMIALQSVLEEGSADLLTAARRVFDGEEAPERLVDLVDLGVAARHGEDDSPLVPARYHFFLRALEGGFVCLHPEHPPAEPSLLLARHERCPTCARAGRGAEMFELGVCRRCGAEYVVGTLEPEGDHWRLCQVSPVRDRPARLLLGEAISDTDDDEDEGAAEASSDHAVAGRLCPACGEVWEGSVGRCGCPSPPPSIAVAIGKLGEAAAAQRCLACARRTRGDVVYRFTTGVDAPVSVIATDLYQEIPPSDEEELAEEVGEGRKLLTFSDSRQDAAFFAPYLERTYRLAVERRLIARALARLEGEEPRTDDLVLPIRQEAERRLVLDPDASRMANQGQVATWLMREILALDRRQSLEGTGIAEIELVFPRRHRAPPVLLSLGFSEQEADDLLHLLLNTLRYQGAVTVAEGVDIRDEAFAPRNVEISVRGEGPGRGVLAWLPRGPLNGRLDLLGRIFERRGIGADPREVLLGLWRMLTDPRGAWNSTLVAHDDRQLGAVLRLSHERFTFRLRTPERPPLRCDRCRQIWWRTVAAACPSYRCPGTVSPVEDLEALDADHYARLYRELEPIGMSVQEHTAQWRSSKASEIQDRFVRGSVNVLSCSTTFELGVDVGEVQAVLLRNVPPSPANYVQRAGRAGRRTGAAALVVCFAQRRSHDLHYFDRPAAMVEGIVPPPRIVLGNASIVRRHIHSVALSAFQREVGDHRYVEDFFLSAEEGRARDEALIDWLRARPEAVGAALRRLVPTEVSEALDLSGWGWVEALVEPSEVDPTQGWLARAGAEVREDLGILRGLIEAAAEEREFKRADQLQRVSRTVAKRFLPGFLAARNVLPKYGFPVDVVELNLARSGDGRAVDLELSRDMKLAIGDYAPGAQTVAAKALWESRGLVVRQDRSWPIYQWTECDSCGAFRHGLEAVADECPACGGLGSERGGRFVMPIYGFNGAASREAPGETRPLRRASIETFFGSYREAPPEFETVEGLNGGGVERRYSPQGLIVVINSGPAGRGFRLCEWCGFGEPIIAAKRTGKTHPNIQRPGRECRGTLVTLHLGHEYLTDVLELRIDRSMTQREARSVLYALLESSAELDVARQDVDGTLHYQGLNQPVLILFDGVPGGAGHTKRLGERLPDLFSAARERAGSCECGPETSCYNCLRSYSNQNWHEALSRGDALRVLDELV